MAKSQNVRVLVGTRKGGYVVEGDASRKKWKVGPMISPGRDVFHMAADPRSPGDIYALANSGFWGPMVLRSRDWGKKWDEISTPLTPLRKDRQPNFELDPAKSHFKALVNLWHIEPGHPSEPDTLFIGADPHALYRSDDLGKSWDGVPGINEHPTKSKWAPGFGGPCFHTVIVDPKDRRRMYVGISSAGMFRTDDGGKKWRPMNKDVECPFFPEDNRYPEVGQCVHKVVLDGSDRETSYRQDHGGIYVSHDGMQSWRRIGKPLKDDFGFCVATSPSTPGKAFFVPLAGESRTTFNGGLQVHEWDDSKAKWRTLMPPSRFPGDYGVQREGIACDSRDPAGIYVGTTTGQLAVSPDAGETWSMVPYQFPAIHSVGIADQIG